MRHLFPNAATFLITSIHTLRPNFQVLPHHKIYTRTIVEMYVYVKSELAIHTAVDYKYGELLLLTLKLVTYMYEGFTTRTRGVCFCPPNRF